MEEPCSDRQWSPTPPRTSAAWTSQARFGIGACRWAESQISVWTRAGTLVEIDFEVFLDRLNTIGMNVQPDPANCRYWRSVPPPSGPDHGQPSNRGGVLVARCRRRIPHHRSNLGSPRIGPTCRRCPRLFATVQDRLPALLDRAEATLQTLREIVARIPDSLDRSDRFFTNVERIVQESQLPALSADSRKFFATTSGQIEQMRSELDGVDRHRGDIGQVL